MKDSLRTVLGVDASTTACKVIVWALDGTAVSEGRAELPLHMHQSAWHEQPATAWWQAVVSSIRKATAGYDISHLAAVCITPQRETFVRVDAHGDPLRPAIVWMDERSREVLPRIVEEYGAERLVTNSALVAMASLGVIPICLPRLTLLYATLRLACHCVDDRALEPAGGRLLRE